MPLCRYSPSDIKPLVRTSLAAEGIKEREDLQRLLMTRIDIISKDLLVVAEEYSLFQDSRRRIDLLALDRSGSLVVIELKRTDDGGHMELQALRYAAMVSTITLEHLVETFADAQSVSLTDARETIVGWLDEPIDELPNLVKIVLISADFSTEITSTVLWLNENYNMDISCFRIVAYRLDDEVLLDLQQIIPLPEARHFQIQQRRKGSAAVVASANERDFTRYNLNFDGEEFPGLSKQGAVKTAIQKLHSAGVSVAQIQSATEAGRWLSVHPEPAESAADAFAREHPSRSQNARWFDLGITSDGNTWVIPRFGGTKTESMLDDLAAVGSPQTSLIWSRVQSADSVVGLEV